MIHAHNEVLSWLSGVGLVGLVLMIFLYGLVYWTCGRLLHQKEIVGLWGLLSMIMFNVRGLAESSEGSAHGWFAFMLVLFLCVRHVVSLPSKPIPKAVLLPTGSRRRVPDLL